jgi:hypothetical protein
MSRGGRAGVTSPSSAAGTLAAVTTAALRATVVPLSPSAPAADPATQHRRRLRYTATLAGVRLRASLPGPSVRRRQALQTCGAARLLTALGIRVDVVQPGTPWPRHRTQLVRITDEAGLLGDLALLTAVPRTTPGWAAVADRVLPAGAPLRVAEAEPADAVVCPVSIGYRSDAGPLTTPPRTLADVVAVVGLVIEVRLHPAVGEVQRAAGHGAAGHGAV